MFEKGFVGCVAIMTVAIAGCAAEAEEKPALTGEWIYVNASGTGGIGLNFDGNGNYVAQILRLTSETSSQTEMETGRYVATDAAVTFTPEQSTCPDDPGEVATLPYRFQPSGALVVTFPDGVISLERNQTTGGSNFIVQFGCRRSGVFKPSPLAPVTP